jgi:hypothetical protein
MRLIPKPFRRRSYKGLAIVFALMTLLDVGLWIRGQTVWGGPFYGRRAPARDNWWEAYYVYNYSNVVSFHRLRAKGYAYDPGLSWRFQSGDNGARLSGVARVIGVEVERDLTSIDVTIAHRTIVIISFALFLLFAKLGWKRRFAPGACQSCGYDLRATPHRCPECGAAPAAPAAR